MTRKKRNIRFKASDAVITVLCLLVLIASLFLFYKDITRIQTKRNEQAIATITFKYRTAQRKLNGRVIWDRLRQESPVYDGDTLRTAEQSEAMIHLKDGNVLNMDENTMIQIFYTETGAALVTNGGTISLDTTAGSAGFTIVTENGSRIETGTGATLSAQTAADGFAVQIQNGTALVASADGTVRTASNGTELRVSADGGISEPPLTVTAPLPNARILHFMQTPADGTDEETAAVPLLFSWKSNRPEPADSVLIELSYDPDFTRITESRTEAASGNAVFPCKSGTVYWRVTRIEANRTDGSRADTGTDTDGTAGNDTTENNAAAETDAAAAAPASVSGKAVLAAVPQPQPRYPPAGTVISYRTGNPVIRFAWDGSDWAAGYELEVSGSPEMTDPAVKQSVSGNSAVTADLAEGTWFWRVTPRYLTQNAAEAEPSPVTPFTIYKKEKLSAPVPVTPGDGSVITRRASEAESVKFAWKADPDAAAYTLTVAADPQSERPVLELNTTDPYVSVPFSAETLDIGTWYWSVTQRDGESDVSEPSPAFRFSVEPRKIPDRLLLYPPENYTVQASSVSAVQFNWKTTDAQNECRLQFAQDETFSNPVIDTQINGQTADGVALAAGTWYWRICAADAETGDPLYSPARAVTVVPELDAPQPILPADGATVVAHNGNPVTFSWQPVIGAQHYTLRVYRTAATESTPANSVLAANSALTANATVPADAEPIAEHRRITGTSVSLHLPAAEQPVSYTWSIEAAAEETENAAARTGRKTERTVSVRSPIPVTLSYPADNELIDGLQALRSPLRFTWTETDPAAQTVFILRRLLPGGITQTVLTRTDPARPLYLERLSAGTYQWTVEARTSDGADIRARNPRTFTVSAPERLSPAVLLQPEAGTVFGPAYFRTHRTLRFAWQSVPEATEYTFTLYRKTPDGTVADPLIRKTLSAEKTELTLRDMSILDAGTFIWNIDTNARAKDGYIERQGTSSQAEFTVDIALPGKILPETPGTLYGN